MVRCKKEVEQQLVDNFDLQVKINAINDHITNKMSMFAVAMKYRVPVPLLVSWIHNSDRILDPKYTERVLKAQRKKMLKEGKKQVIDYVTKPRVIPAELLARRELMAKQQGVPRDYGSIEPEVYNSVLFDDAYFTYKTFFAHEPLTHEFWGANEVSSFPNVYHGIDEFPANEVRKESVVERERKVPNYSVQKRQKKIASLDEMKQETYADLFGSDDSESECSIANVGRTEVDSRDDEDEPAYVHEIEDKEQGRLSSVSEYQSEEGMDVFNPEDMSSDEKSEKMSNPQIEDFELVSVSHGHADSSEETSNPQFNIQEVDPHHSSDSQFLEETSERVPDDKHISIIKDLLPMEREIHLSGSDTDSSSFLEDSDEGKVDYKRKPKIKLTAKELLQLDREAAKLNQPKKVRGRKRKERSNDKTDETLENASISDRGRSEKEVVPKEITENLEKPPPKQRGRKKKEVISTETTDNLDKVKPKGRGRKKKEQTSEDITENVENVQYDSGVEPLSEEAMENVKVAPKRKAAAKPRAAKSKKILDVSSNTDISPGEEIPKPRKVRTKKQTEKSTEETGEAPKTKERKNAAKPKKAKVLKENVSETDDPTIGSADKDILKATAKRGRPKKTKGIIETIRLQRDSESEIVNERSFCKNNENVASLLPEGNESGRGYNVDITNEHLHIKGLHATEEDIDLYGLW